MDSHTHVQSPTTSRAVWRGRVADGSRFTQRYTLDFDHAEEPLIVEVTLGDIDLLRLSNVSRFSVRPAEPFERSALVFGSRTAPGTVRSGDTVVDVLPVGQG